MSNRSALLTPVDEATNPEHLLPVFNSNPDWIDAISQFVGKARFSSTDVEMFLYTETRRENSRCMTIRVKDTEEIVGILTFIAPHPRTGQPWIGTLILHGDHRRRGHGSEVVGVLEKKLQGEK